MHQMKGEFFPAITKCRQPKGFLERVRDKEYIVDVEPTVTYKNSTSDNFRFFFFIFIHKKNYKKKM